MVLAWAIAASVVLHAAVLIATLPGGRPGTPLPGAPDLRVSLEFAPPRQEASHVPEPAVVATMPDRSPVSVPAASAPPPARPTAAASAPHAGSGKIKIVVHPIAGGMRLGDYSALRANRFPSEVDRPVRMDQKIEVRYPESALAHGREDAVTVWAIVDASGKVQDVYVAEGTDEFTEEVIAVVRATHFLPAENNLKPIRYPIALQFDFRIPGLASARDKEQATSTATR
jgi:TonB family protein